jgi:hypothetical protein
MKRKYLILIAVVLISTPLIVPQVQSVYAYYAGIYSGLIDRLEKVEQQTEAFSEKFKGIENVEVVALKCEIESLRGSRDYWYKKYNECKGGKNDN